MKKIKHLFWVACMLAAGETFAQTPTHPQYVKESPENVPFYDAYRAWTDGNSLYENDDDEEFFISRVKPKTRFTNPETQVDPEMNSERKLLWWCPIGTTDGNWKSTPSYFFDSEVFSMWSYVDIYGNWTAPFIRMAGAFTDVCHKNGVKTSVLASVPWASTIEATDEGHGQNMKAMIDGGSDKLLKFLRYYGIDGIGYNSEFNIGKGLSAEGLKQLLSECFAKKDAANWPTFTNSWYSLMNNSGSVGGTDWLSGSNKDWFNYNGHPTSDGYFMNYNWGASGLATSQETAKSFEGRSSFDVYGGMDFQGRNVADWLALKNADISVGIWGAHNMNMIFESRGELGSSAIQKQTTYQLISENVFTGATYNPIDKLPIQNKLIHNSTNTEFHGFSQFITARSTLVAESVQDHPFVTYFNLGNGTFFNAEGQKEYSGQWYNIGMQDYLPTWRWWWSNVFMGRDKSNVPTSKMTAEFTWDDAWFGGSCLSVSGQTDNSYLQLFKTKYKLVSGDELVIRYKVVSGSGTIGWACSTEDKTSAEKYKKIADLSGATKEWQEKKFRIASGPLNYSALVNQTLAMMGLKFSNTSNDFKILIGEISLRGGSNSVTPVQPKLVKSEFKTFNYKGLDFKMVYSMKEREAGSAEPVYNEDVDTWFYKIYTQQEGAEPVLCTATTSWAAYVVAAPYDTTVGGKVRVGVSAVSLDGRTESAIAWSDYSDIPSLEIVEGIEIDKAVIKANEPFKISYVDPNHAPAESWEILNAQTGEKVKEFANSLYLEASLEKNGIYDLRLTVNGVPQLYQGLIQISPEEVGAMPEIRTLTANNSSEAITVTKESTVEYAYTGRPSDGTVSRGLRMSEVAFGIPCKQLNFNDQSNFTITFWFNPVVFNHMSGGTQLLNIRKSKSDWPISDWGYIWSQIDPDNTFQMNIRINPAGGIGAGSETKIRVPGYTFDAGQWYHIALVIGYNNGREVAVYVNGKLIESQGNITSLYYWDNDYLIMIGGKASGRAGFDGNLDEFQLYNKALTAEEVKKSMEHQTVIPESLIGYWDFETDADENNKIYSTGKQPFEAYMTEIKTVSKGNNEYIPVQMTFGTGAPFIQGDKYKIQTQPSWKLEEASDIRVSEGTDLAGSATAIYKKDGVYSATLTLANGWGEATKTFQFVTVDGSGVGIPESELGVAYNAYPNPFVNELYVRFADEGTYTIEVFDAAGKLVETQETTVADGGDIHLSVNGAAGIYFINIKQDAKILKALKVIKN